MEPGNERREMAIGKIVWATIVVVMLCGVTVGVCTISNEVHNHNINKQGYDDGYTQHNETIYKYSTDYAKSRSDITEYYYCKGYCNGYQKWYLETTKPEGMRY